MGNDGIMSPGTYAKQFRKFMDKLSYVNSVSRVRIPLCPPELKSLYFEENTEIQAFLLPTENSFK